MGRPTALRKIITARAVDYDVGYRILLRRDRAIQRICAIHGPPFAVRSDRPPNWPTEESHCPVISSAERRSRPTPKTKQLFSDVTPTICLCAARWATLDSPTRTNRFRGWGPGDQARAQRADIGRPRVSFQDLTNRLPDQRTTAFLIRPLGSHQK